MKRGFTLIELLITIVLIGGLLALTAISIIKIKDDISDNLYDEKIEYIVAGAKEWGNDNLNSLNASSCTCVSVDSLISSGYLAGDDASRSNLDNPLETESLNNKYVCLKYVPSSALVSTSTVYDFEVTAEYKGETCN